MTDRGDKLRRALYLFSGLGIRILATLALIPLLGRTLGPEAFGVYAVAYTVTMVVWQVVEFGVQLIASRRYARADAQADKDAALTVATFGRLTMVPPALALGAAIVWFSPVLSGHAGVAALAALLGVQSGLNFGWLLTAQGASRMQSMLETAPALITLLLCMLFVQTPQDVAIVFVIMNAGALLANTVGWLYSRQHVRHRRPVAAELRRAIGAGRAVFLYRVALVITTTGSAYILGWFVTGDQVGNYALADRLLSAAAGLLQPLAVVVFPDSMRLFAQRPADAARQYGAFTLKVTAVTLVMVLMVQWLGPWLIPLAMGPKYAPSVPVLLTLIWALPLMALSQMVVSCILYPLNRDWSIGLTYVAGTALLAGLSAMLLPSLGAGAMPAIRVGVEALIAVVLCAVAWLAVRASTQRAPMPTAVPETT